MHHNTPENDSQEHCLETPGLIGRIVSKIKGSRAFWGLSTVLLISGAAVMVFELTGSRILAPFAGTSIFVWSNLIGVILGSLSLGYWLGGRFADKNPSILRFAYITLASGGLLFLAAIAHNSVLAALLEAGDIKTKSFLAALILFAPASTSMGMLTPYAARLAIKNVDGSGKTVGALYAISTIGSIAGTFLAGFILIPTFANTTILAWTSAALLVSGTAIFPAKRPLIKIAIAVAFLFLFQLLSASLRKDFRRGIIADTNSAYNRIIILDTTHPITSRPTRYLITDIAGVQSAIFLDDEEELAAEYTKFYRLGGYLNPNMKKALMIGGGGYSYPKDFLRNFPEAKMDVVEIDPKVTELARKYFGLKPDPRLSIFHEDGRVFLSRTENKYGAIMLDAFQGCSPLWHLGTLEAVQKIYDMLEDGGILVSNIPGALEGPSSKFLNSEYLTYKAVFPTVLAFAAADSQSPRLAQNVMILGIKGDPPSPGQGSPEAKELLQKIWTGNVGKGGLILRDEHAPVEFFQKELCSSESYFTQLISSAVLR